MKRLLLMMIPALMISCTDKKDEAVSKCLPGGYKEGIKRGLVPYKTTTVQVNDTIYKLDYVRDHKGKWPAYGNLEMTGENFKGFLKHAGLSARYPDAEKVRAVTFFAGGDTIEKAALLQWKNILCYDVVYIDADGYAALDFTDEKHAVKETYRISQSYASVKDYLLRQRSGVTDNPCIIDMVNEGCALEGAKRVWQSEDVLYQKANPDK